MKKIGHYLYNIIFWISRVFGVLALAIGLFIVLQIKYAISERYFYFLFDFIFRNSDTVNINFFNINVNFFEIISFLFIAFCKFVRLAMPEPVPKNFSFNVTCITT